VIFEDLAEKPEVVGGPNYYLIEPPASVGLSGGRTSAYMTYKILEAYQGKFYQQQAVSVVFPKETIFLGREEEE
jgi:hypothetical protein